MMKYVRFLIGGCVLAGGLLLAVGTLNAGEPLMLRVETRADGTCSFDAALRVVERQRTEDPSRAIVVRVPSGLWRVSGPVELDARHARAGWGRLTVFGEPGSGLLGSRRIRDWRKEGFNGRADVWTADVSAFGLAQVPELLFFNGRRMIRARWPNADPALPYSGGWAYVDGTPTGMYAACPGASRQAFTVREKDARTWRCPEEGLVDIFPQYNWINEERKIAAWDPTTRRLTLSHGLRFEARPGDRYILEGLREELDAPGEWYCDRAAGKIHFIPPKGEDPNAGVVSIPSGGPVLRLKGVANVDVIGLEIAEADEGLRAEDAERLRVVGCRFHDIGGFFGSAVQIAHATRCVVADCDIWDIGAHGISLSGGEPTSLERSRNRIENCYIHHTGRVDRHGIGVLIAGQGTTVAHCLIHDMPRAALIHRGRLHTIEYNVIRDVNLEMEDTGAIYGGGWVNGAGTVIRYNRISNSVGYATREGAYKFGFFASGIHFDEAIGGVEVYGNVVERANLAALNLHNARYITITNNIFISNAGKEGWLDQIQVQGWNADTNGYFVTQRQKSISREWHAVVDVQPSWTNFPSLAHSPDDPFLADGTVMRGNVVRDNQFFYPDQPTAVYARLRDCNLTANAFAANALCSGTNDVKVNLVSGVTLPDGTCEKGRVNWTTWRRHGGDAGSRLLDARTSAPDFSRVPVAQMGLVATPRRKLPMREAEGVREHPEWLTLPPDVPELWKK